MNWKSSIGNAIRNGQLKKEVKSIEVPNIDIVENKIVHRTSCDEQGVECNVSPCVDEVQEMPVVTPQDAQISIGQEIVINPTQVEEIAMQEEPDLYIEECKCNGEKHEMCKPPDVQEIETANMLMSNNLAQTISIHSQRYASPLSEMQLLINAVNTLIAEQRITNDLLRKNGQ